MGEQSFEHAVIHLKVCTMSPVPEAELWKRHDLSANRGGVIAKMAQGDNVAREAEIMHSNDFSYFAVSVKYQCTLLN